MAEEKKKTRITKQGLSSALSMFRYLKPYSGYFYGALVLLVIGSFLMMAIMGIPGQMVSAATDDIDVNPLFDFDLNTWGLIMFWHTGC